MFEAFLRAISAFYGVEPHFDETADETKAAIIEKQSKLNYLEVGNPIYQDCL